MKINFDTNTKNSDAAANAWVKIDAEASPKDLTLTIKYWNGLYYNISGEVDSQHIKLIEDLFDTYDFSEYANDL